MICGRWPTDTERKKDMRDKTMADERVYTERELKEMADRLLEADRPEQAEKPGGKRKSGKTKET